MSYGYHGRSFDLQVCYRVSIWIVGLFGSGSQRGKWKVVLSSFRIILRPLVSLNYRHVIGEIRWFSKNDLFVLCKRLSIDVVLLKFAMPSIDSAAVRNTAFCCQYGMLSCARYSQRAAPWVARLRFIASSIFGCAVRVVLSHTSLFQRRLDMDYYYCAVVICADHIWWQYGRAVEQTDGCCDHVLQANPRKLGSGCGTERIGWTSSDAAVSSRRKVHLTTESCLQVMPQRSRISWAMFPSRYN